MARFLLHHWHQPHECASAFAAWSGFDSPLRRGRALSTCLTGGHRLWWQVEAEGEREALGLLPSFVARRASATQVREIEIP